MSILALDIGDKKIGLAISFSQIQARPLKTIAAQDLTSLIKIIQDFKVSRLIVGEPRNQNGLATKQTKKVYHYLTKLKRALDEQKIKLEIILQDERLSTFHANQLLTGKSIKIKHRQIHNLSAQIILEQYLARLRQKI